MSHGSGRAPKMYDGSWIRIRKPFDVKVGDWVFTHGNGEVVYPSRISSIRGTLIVLDESRTINKKGLLAVIDQKRFPSMPIGVKVHEIKAALEDYGRLQVMTYSRYATEVLKFKDDYR